MPFRYGEPISSVSDKELSSLHQIDLKAVQKAKSKEPSYIAYKALQAHRRTLNCLQTSVDLQHQKASSKLSNAMQNIDNTKQQMNDVNDYPDSQDPTTRPSIEFGILLSIVELQKLYYAQKLATFGECAEELGGVDELVHGVAKKVKEMERFLVKKWNVRTVDDEGNALKGRDVEHAIDVMAMRPGITID